MSIDIKIFYLPAPTGYDEAIENADRLLAELLVRYYFSKNDFTEGEEYGKMSDKQ